MTNDSTTTDEESWRKVPFKTKRKRQMVVGTGSVTGEIRQSTCIPHRSWYRCNRNGESTEA